MSLFPLHATHASIWTGATSTDWFDAGNWSGGVPTSGIDANINTTVNAPMIAGVGATNGYLYLGNTATGLLNISSGGTLTSNNIQNIGTYSGYTGIATVSGSGSSWSVSTTMRVGNSGDGQLIIDQGGQVSNVMALIGRNVGSSGLVLVSGTNSRWVNSDLSVGSSGQGTLNITASGYVSSTTGSIGVNVGSSGTAIVDGAGSLWSNSSTLSVAASGSGTMTISNGGKVTNTTGYIGNCVGSTGTSTVSGAGSIWANSSDLYVGNFGSGTLDISDNTTVSSGSSLFLGTKTGSSGVVNISSSGRLTSTNHSIIASDSGSTGTATVSGMGSIWTSANEFFIGGSGSGTLNILYGGSVSAAGASQIGRYVGSSGIVNITGTGSVWRSVANSLYVGDNGMGFLTVSDGGASNCAGPMFVGTHNHSVGAVMVSNAGIISSGAAFLGYNAGSTGDATITGAGSRWINSGTFSVGNSSSGTLNITASGYVSATAAYIANAAGSTGTATVTGLGSTWTNSSILLVGNSGTGTLRISDSGTVSTTGAIIAQNAGSTGTLIIGSASGTAATAAGTLTTPTVTFGSGTGSILFNHTATNYVFSSAITGAGSIAALSGVTNLTGNLSAFTGTTTVSDAAQLFLSGTYGGDVDVDGGGEASLDANVGGSVTVTDGTASITATIAQDLTLSGTSTAILASTATIGGDVTIGAGSVFSDNGTVSGNVDVNNGGTLKGSGTVGGDANVNNGGTIAPGNSIGTLNVVGDVNFAAGSIYEVEVNAAGQSDSIIATGNANITGGTINIVPEAGSVYGVGTTYTFLTAANVIGTFDAVTLNASSLFLNASLSYDATNAYATLTRNGTAFASAAATGNQVNVAQALDSLPVNSLSNAVAGQSTTTGAQATFHALTGELHAGIKGGLLEGGTSFAQGLAARQNTHLVAQRNLWAQAYGDWSERNGDNSNTRAFEHTERGISFGYNAPAQGWIGRSGLMDVLGVAFSYGRSDYDLATDPDNSASGNADHYRLAAYGSKELGSVSLRANGQYGLHMIETDRRVSFTGYSAGQRAAYHAQSLGGLAEAAYGFKPAPAAHIEPFAQISYGMVKLADFVEDGGDGALRANSDLASQGGMMMGTRLSYNLPLSGQSYMLASSSNSSLAHTCNDGRLTSGGTPCALIKAQLGWKRLIGSANPTGTYNFAGSDNFTTMGAGAPRNAALIDIGIGLPLTPHASLDLTANAAFAPAASSSTIRGGFSWKW